MKLAIGGKMRSGKDCSVNYLIREYGGSKINFSKHIYDILEFVQRKCNFPLKKDRNFLQWMGTYCRDKDPNIWVNLTLEDIPISGNVYCSDVRFLNEFLALKNKGFIMIKIIRDDDKKIIKNDDDTNHISETEIEHIPLDQWDFVIDNNDYVKDLYIKLDEIVKKLN